MAIDENRNQMTFDDDECECPDCKLLRNTPSPRNRAEYRRLPKSVRDIIESRNFFHMDGNEIGTNHRFEIYEYVPE